MGTRRVHECMHVFAPRALDKNNEAWHVEGRHREEARKQFKFRPWPMETGHEIKREGERARGERGDEKDIAREGEKNKPQV